MEYTTFYKCDPSKNVKCKKEHCRAKHNSYGCFTTSRVECARLDEFGKPIVDSYIW